MEGLRGWCEGERDDMEDRVHTYTLDRTASMRARGRELKTRDMYTLAPRWTSPSNVAIPP
eukprot:6664052-Pyramimonas_sp.AAC.1